MKSLFPDLALLALSLAVSQAYAADVVQTGPNGANGVAGTTTTVATNGANGPTQTVTLGPNGDASNTLTLTGGNGGGGGDGGPGMTNSAIGSGGNGADANGAVITASTASSVVAKVTVFGGSGGGAGNLTPDDDGNVDLGALGGAVIGNGGSAQASSSATGSGNANVTSSAYATGGDGAAANWFLTNSGSAGNASASAYGKSDTGNVTVSAGATGGNSNNGDYDNSSGFGLAGASVTLDNAVSGSTAGVLTLSQSATGGNGGTTSNAPPAEYFPWPDNGGGSATSRLTLSDATASVLNGTVSATGGDGGYSLGALGGSGGDATAVLTLASTKAGAPLVGTAAALGGTGGSSGYGSRSGGAAVASATLTGTGAVTGTAKATGGTGGSVQWPMAAGGTGGSATAGLTLQGGGLVTGTVEAHGGASGGALYNIDLRGTADATLTITGGAGAIGTSTATGGVVTSTINSVTNGTLAVNLTGTAIGYTSALSNVTLQSNGLADVTAASYAYADENTGFGPSGAPATSNLTISAGGNIVGTSYALGGGGVAGFKGNAFTGGDANASAAGTAGGSHMVMLNATAQAGNQATEDNQRWVRAGSATASVYGKSDSGMVNVTATANGGSGDRNSPYGNMIGNGSASATAISNGLATAQALATGKDVSATAQAQSSVNRYTASAGGIDGTVASSYASNQYNAWAVALPGMGGSTNLVSNAVGGVTGAEREALLASNPNLSSQLGTITGVGMQGAISADQWDASSIHQYTTSGDFQFNSTQAEHLLVGFISSTFLGSGFNALDLTISANGTQLFSQTFTSLAQANAFFNDHVVDLGLFGAGTQDVSIRSTFSFLDPAGYAFNYAVDGGLPGSGGPSAVPEPSGWMMMVIGIGGLMLVARRRKATGGAA